MERTCLLDSAIDASRNPAASAALARAAVEAGWPVRFPGDLRHDQEALAHYRPAAFGWILHEDGTDLLLVEQLAEAIGCLRFWSRGNEPRRLYVWACDRLLPVEDLATLEQHLLAAAYVEAA